MNLFQDASLNNVGYFFQYWLAFHLIEIELSLKVNDNLGVLIL
jgi:hypothetical protein